MQLNLPFADLRSTEQIRIIFKIYDFLKKKAEEGADEQRFFRENRFYIKQTYEITGAKKRWQIVQKQP